jgi:hypothetical protein
MLVERRNLALHFAELTAPHLGKPYNGLPSIHTCVRPGSLSSLQCFEFARLMRQLGCNEVPRRRDSATLGVLFFTERMS